MKKTNDSGYQWKYNSVGGVVRVAIKSGEDIAHLGELDQKKWTVLSCPTKGLEFDAQTLSWIDADKDGKIRVHEVVAAADWLCSIIKNKDGILKGSDTLPLAQIDETNETGARLLSSAKQILSNLGLDKDSISTADTADSVAIFAKTQFNGDGVITPASADDEALKKVIESAVTCVGSVTDRSGEQGVNAEIVEKFYAACADYNAWLAAAEADKAGVYPFGDNTEAALAACEALKEKIADYYMRCKLISFNDAVAGAVDVSVDRISAISDKNLASCADEIASYPLARPSADQALPFNAINPAWKAAFDQLKALVLDSELAGKDSMTEAEWNAIIGKFGAYTAWKGAKAGAEVEALGADYVAEVIKADGKAAILELIAKDEAVKSEAESIDEVRKISHLYRDFYKLLKNYVSFTDFYSLNPEDKAVFEAGKLYIDERCCELCIRVEDMGKHADMAGQSGMFLIYCSCTSKTKNETINVVAVLTAGSVMNLRPGKHGIYYDRQGNDWDATIIKVVDNPISIKNAFWSPYRKLSNFISDKFNKSVAEKDAAAVTNLQSNVGAEGGPKAPFDIAKFAGIGAAVGIAIGAIGGAIGLLISALKGISWWQYLIIIAAIMIVISGPACIMAWLKLRKRNLGPVLNANGWAINSSLLVNILFGNTLTSVAKYPIVKGGDPFKKKTPLWKKILGWLVAIVIVAAAALYFTDNLGCIGIHRHKAEPVEEVAEAVAKPEAEAEAEVAVEEAAAEEAAE